MKPPVQSAIQCIIAQVICAPLHEAHVGVSVVFLLQHSVAQVSVLYDVLICAFAASRGG